MIEIVREISRFFIWLEKKTRPDDVYILYEYVFAQNLSLFKHNFILFSMTQEVEFSCVNVF